MSPNLEWCSFCAVKLGYFIGDSPLASEKGSVASLSNPYVSALGFIVQNFGWGVQNVCVCFRALGHRRTRPFITASPNLRHAVLEAWAQPLKIRSLLSPVSNLQLLTSVFNFMHVMVWNTDMPEKIFHCNLLGKAAAERVIINSVSKERSPLWARFLSIFVLAELCSHARFKGWVLP